MNKQLGKVHKLRSESLEKKQFFQKKSVHCEKMLVMMRSLNI